MWSLKRKAPACDSADDHASTRSTADNKTLISLEERMNSSRQLPGIARISNEVQQQPGRPKQLLSMPDKIFQKILRYAVVETSPICVAADYPDDSSEKNRGALSICHRLREIARPMFYRENTFEIQIFQFDITAVLPWLKIAEKFLPSNDARSFALSAKSKLSPGDSDSEITTETGLVESSVPRAFEKDHGATIGHPPKFGKPSAEVVEIFTKSYDHFIAPKENPDKATPATTKQTDMLVHFMGQLDRTLCKEPSSTGEIYLAAHYEPHWDNLVMWMKLYHAGQVGRYRHEKAYVESSAAVAGMFNLVDCEKEEMHEWKAFESRLYALRCMLAATDEKWLED